MSTGQLRQKFLQYFKKNGHETAASDSLIPSGDPSLLFTSAGMVQFKKHFLGQTKLTFRRAASCQKCLRTSDIDRVGLTARHLTFFEMLGNFSFGDYFKKEAIAWGWEFLTQEAGLSPKSLYASVYKEDDEALALWKKILPESKIVRLGEESNFWNMGPTGPCGPCSEVLFDRGEKLMPPGHVCPGPGCDCDRYMEVWNLVFTQFDRKEGGKLEPLPQKNIDTGMGLERLSVAAGGKSSAFEIDYFQSLISEIKKLIGPKASEKKQRIISDHVRACTFLISDGVLPSNEGRGYILRRLLRRALREGWTEGKKEPFLHELAQGVVRDMAEAYPELPGRLSAIRSIMKTEEENTLSTIEAGTKTLESEVRKAAGKKEAGGTLGKVSLSGEKVFQIYDTYGLGKEIQSEIVRDWGGELVYSEPEYEKAREAAVTAARAGWKGSGEKDLGAYSALYKKHGNTVFKAYETLELETRVLAILKDGKEVSELKQGMEGEAILSETPFYAESGGQVGDKGTLEGSNFSAEVLDTQKPYEGVIAHPVKVTRGNLKAGDKVSAKVDKALRRHTMRHHTATHLLHAALRRTLGEQVSQAGSLVSPEKLRFDFTFPRALEPAEISAIEFQVNSAVLENIPRKRSEEPLEEARKLGALAFFGEKYGSKVFVVNYGEASTEVCGGTHCLFTGEIGAFKITSQSSVGSGIRRLEAVAGIKALEYFSAQEKILRDLAGKLKSSLEDIPQKVEKLNERLESLEKEIRGLKKHGAKGGLADLLEGAVSLPSSKNGDIKVVSDVIEAPDLEALREAADHVRDKLGKGVVILAAANGGKTSFVVTVSPQALDAGYHAGKIAKTLAGKIGGSGGGKELFAQGGGKAVPDLKDILRNFPSELRGHLT